MGAAGTDTAMEAADVVVMNDDLRRIAETVKLSRSTHAVLWQNITLALGIKAVFFVSPSLKRNDVDGGLRRHGANLLVVLNGLRLLQSAESLNGRGMRCCGLNNIRPLSDSHPTVMALGPTVDGALRWQPGQVPIHSLVMRDRR